MYQPTVAQTRTEAALAKQGFRFSNWLPFQPDADNQPAEGTEHLGTMLVKRIGSASWRACREIEPDGSIN